jgi:hypothetical protein
MSTNYQPGTGQAEKYFYHPVVKLKSNRRYPEIIMKKKDVGYHTSINMSMNVSQNLRK